LGENQENANNLTDLPPALDLDSIVSLTWKGKVDDDDMIAVYQKLELYTITPGLDHELTDEDNKWWMLKIYDFTNTLYVAFYLNLIPFLVVIISSVMFLNE